MAHSFWFGSHIVQRLLLLQRSKRRDVADVLKLIFFFFWVSFSIPYFHPLLDHIFCVVAFVVLLHLLSSRACFCHCALSFVVFCLLLLCFSFCHPASLLSLCSTSASSCGFCCHASGFVVALQLLPSLCFGFGHYVSAFVDV